MYSEVEPKYEKFQLCFLLQLLYSRLMYVSSIALICLQIWISMAQIQQGGPDEKEKTTALKGTN